MPGARILLERIVCSETDVTYRVVVSEDDKRSSGNCVFTRDGSTLQLDGCSEEGAVYITRVLKVMHKNHNTERFSRWPRKVHRWRDESLLV